MMSRSGDQLICLICLTVTIVVTEKRLEPETMDYHPSGAVMIHRSGHFKRLTTVTDSSGNTEYGALECALLCLDCRHRWSLRAIIVLLIDCRFH